MEPIDASNSLTVVLPVSKDFLPSKEPTEPSVVIDAFPVLDESLPSMEATEEQSMTDESIGVSNLRMEEVMPVSEILDKALVCMPLQLISAPPSKELCWMYLTPKCLSHARRNAPMKSLPPKPPDWTYRAMSNPPQPPDSTRCVVATRFVYHMKSWYSAYIIVIGTLGNIKNEELGTMLVLYDENGCGYMNLKGVEIELYPDYFTVVYGIIKLIEALLLATEVLSKIDSQYNHFCVIGEHRIAQDNLAITKGADKNISMGEIITTLAIAQGKYVGIVLFNAPPSGLELEFDFHANVGTSTFPHDPYFNDVVSALGVPRAMLNVVVVGIVYHMLLVSTKGGKATLSKDAHIPYGSHHRFSTITQPRNSHNSINAHILFQPVLVCGNQLNIQDMPSLWLPRSFSEYANSPWPQIVQLVDVSVSVAAVLDSCPKVTNGFTTTCSAYNMVLPMSVAEIASEKSYKLVQKACYQTPLIF
ncbi:hypothetical protein L195_g014112 [Trifolium pratense]|uniref:Uncharacterized protein n=1 Tax=Trifolium pratense TaxID=57577 RepID=A0A2K3PQ21_TRIPR|nr:hypothetical protein L195_g014112 [Trifolium pratense]